MSEVILEIKDSVAIVTLNRPEKMNAFNRAMALALQAILDQCAADNTVRCVYLTGAGKVFSAGQDLVEAVGPGNGLKNILAEHYNPIIRRLRNIEKPVIAAVHGVAAGAAANVALSCDIVVASTSASFIQAFSKIGLIPDSGGTFILPRLIGWQKAAAVMMLGEKISAVEAERIGMIYKVFSDEEYQEASLDLARSIALMPTRALALTKQALNRSMSNDLEQQLQAEDELQAVAASTSDFREGVWAFLQKRAPNFKGE